jgi:hypothetical protein
MPALMPETNDPNSTWCPVTTPDDGECRDISTLSGTHLDGQQAETNRDGPHVGLGRQGQESPPLAAQAAILGRSPLIVLTRRNIALTRRNNDLQEL